MEVIQKEILIEPAISRMPGLIPSIDRDNPLTKNGNWGLIVSDIDFDKITDTSDPFYSLKSFGIMSYRNLMLKYYWIRNYYDNIEYFKYRNNRWVPYNGNIENLGVVIYKDLSDVLSPSHNMIVGINEDLDTFNLYGGDIFFNFVEESFCKIYIPDNIIGLLVPIFLYGVEVEEWYEWLLKNRDNTDCCVQERYIAMGGDEMLNFLSLQLTNITIKKNYFENLATFEAQMYLPIVLTNTIDEMGLLNNMAEEWVYGKRYYIGEIVSYEGETYVLIRNQDNKSKEYYQYNGSSWARYMSPIEDKIDTYRNLSEIVNPINGDIVCIDIGYVGYFDETYKDIYFDDFNGYGYYKYDGSNWVRTDAIETTNNVKKYSNLPISATVNTVYYVEDDELILNHWQPNTQLPIIHDDIVETRGESKLTATKRIKRSFDDENNELPGILSPIIGTDPIEFRDDLELFYQKDIAYNVEENEDLNGDKVYYGDIITKIYRVHDNIYEEYKWDVIEVTVSGSNVRYIVNIWEEFTPTPDEEVSEDNVIIFKYVIGGQVKLGDSEISPDTFIRGGVAFTDMYPYREYRTVVMVNNVEREFNYIEIDYDAQTIFNLTLDSSLIKSILSDMEYPTDDLLSENPIDNSRNIIESPVYRSECFFGITSQPKTDINVFIERGTAAAFERFLSLGEIKTLQDMAEYKNNFYQMN